jgi:GNAT superfamily N-acetyltransferase
VSIRRNIGHLRDDTSPLTRKVQLDGCALVHYTRNNSQPTSMTVKRIQNRDAIARLLRSEPAQNADQLGYLDECYQDVCEWYGEVGDEGLRTIVLVYDGLSRPGLFTAGDPAGIRPILHSAQLPERVTGHFVSAHRDAVFTAYRATDSLRRMSRMLLTRDDYQARESSVEVCRLGHVDTGAIMSLYRHWRDNFFEPFQLETGLYFGVREAGELVAIAGVHNLSDQFDVATIGNLVTHPDYRGRGYGSAVTARLLDETFEHVTHVTLDVQGDNEPAVRTYRRFGFEHRAEFYEGELILKGIHV